MRRICRKKRGKPAKKMSDIDELIKMLDTLTTDEVSRIKIETSAQMEEGVVKRAYHHGRCDVGSPFATGKLYDFEEQKGTPE